MSDSDPNDRALRLNAALDGELNAANELEFERALGSDATLAMDYRRLQALREAVRRHVPREEAPQALVDGIAALTQRTPSSVVDFAPVRRPVWRDTRALALAASFAVLGFAVGAGLTSLRTPNATGSAADGLVSDFARAEISGQPFDVASSDRHTVKPWLAGRTTVSADIVDLASQGFPLAGGRVAVVDRIPAPTLVYRHGEHLVAVTELPLDAMGARAARGIETIDGYHVARWSDANLAYVAVSDMDERTLADFVQAFRQARNRGAEAPAR
jgi:anti-sigma factor RsiW